MRLCLIMLASLAPLFLSGYLSAETIHLVNGDTLTGEVTEDHSTYIVFKHAQLGSMRIERSALLTIPESTIEAIKETQEKSAEPLPTPEAATVPENTGAQDTSPDVIEELDPAWLRILQNMNAKLGLSFNLKEASTDTRDIRFFFNSAWENGINDYKIDTEYRYGKSNGDVKDNRYKAVFRYRRQNNKSLFFQSNTAFKNDDVRDIQLWLEQALGMGWKQTPNSSFEYSLGPQIKTIYEDLDNPPEDHDDFSIVGSLFQDSIYKINENYTLNQEAEVYLNPENTDNWGHSFTVDLEGRITKAMSFRLGLEWNYDNLVSEDVSKNEAIFNSSLLYTF